MWSIILTLLILYILVNFFNSGLILNPIDSPHKGKSSKSGQGFPLQKTWQELNADGFRVIKRNQNYKLFDTKSYEYIGTEDIKSLLVKGEDVIVFDTKTNHDITCQILLSIIQTNEVCNGIKKQSSLTKVIKQSNAGFTNYIYKREVF